jgi:hypothetical protein
MEKVYQDIHCSRLALGESAEFRGSIFGSAWLLEFVLSAGVMYPYVFTGKHWTLNYILALHVSSEDSRWNPTISEQFYFLDSISYDICGGTDMLMVSVA